MHIPFPLIEHFRLGIELRIEMLHPSDGFKHELPLFLVMLIEGLSSVLLIISLIFHEVFYVS